LNQAAARSVRDRFGSADDIHLGEDGFHMRLHGAFTKKESRTILRQYSSQVELEKRIVSETGAGGS
jgi:hypothetical protein